MAARCGAMTGSSALVVGFALCSAANARADSVPFPCVPDRAATAHVAGTLAKRTGHPVEIAQACSAKDGGFVAFTFAAGGHKTAQIARCDARSRCSILETWRDIQNCDDGMCDHFSTIDVLSIASTSDIDGDGTPDALLDYTSITGDQGSESHRVAVWLSKKHVLQQLGSFEGQIEGIEAKSTGIAITTRDWISTESTQHCFAIRQRGVTRTCPM